MELFKQLDTVFLFLFVVFWFLIFKSIACLLLVCQHFVQTTSTDCVDPMPWELWRSYNHRSWIKTCLLLWRKAQIAAGIGCLDLRSFSTDHWGFMKPHTEVLLVLPKGSAASIPVYCSSCKWNTEKWKHNDLYWDGFYPLNKGFFLRGYILDASKNVACTRIYKMCQGVWVERRWGENLWSIIKEDEGHVWGRQYPFPPPENTQLTGKGFSAWKAYVWEALLWHEALHSCALCSATEVLG